MLCKAQRLGTALIYRCATGGDGNRIGLRREASKRKSWADPGEV
jgi:hypothetical protein